MKILSLKYSIKMLLGLAILLLGVSCSAPLQTVSALVEETGSFTLFLQPLPQEMHHLSFTIAELVALRSDGEEFDLPLTMDQFSDQLIGTQQELLNLTLPPGHYRGLAMLISRANLQGEGGSVALLPPKDRLIVEFPFTIRKKRSKTLFLSLSTDRLVTDGVLFTPKFSLWKPERILSNLKGFVSNSGSGSLTIFNKRTAQVIGKLQTGGNPTALALDQRQHWLYVALEKENAILVVEVTNGSVLGRIPLRFGDGPTELALTANGRTLLCLNQGSESVSIIDPNALFETARIRLRSEPSGIFIGRDETQAYVTHATSSKLTVLDLQDQTIRGSVSLEESPLAGVSSGDGRSLYLINNFSADLSVIDTASLRPQGKIFIGNGAISIRSDSTSGLLYIGKQNGEIAVADPRSLMAIDTYRLTGTVQDLTIDNEENALFAVLPQSRSLIKIDLVSKRVLGRLKLESGSRAVVVMGER